MHHRMSSFGALLLAMALGALSSCSANARKAESGPAPLSNEEQPVAVAQVQPRYDDDLHMFGRGAAAHHIVFEGKAATDLRQHTEPSEGADFDVDVDPAGKMLVMASTRHSRNSHIYVKSVEGATMTQLTDGPGNDAQPCYDPAGTRIAFTSDRSGNWDIWVVDLSGRNPIQVTNSPLPELNPTWSPDGRKIAYCRLDPREDRGSLWIVDLENPGVKRLIGEGMFPSWSPQGDKIAYQRAKARSSRWYSIWTIDVHNDEVLFPTEVASSPNGALVTPVWSHDGARLAFCMITAQTGEPQVREAGLARRSAAVADIGVVDVDGRGLQSLTDGAGECYAPAWSRDGRVFFSQRAEGRETIWSIRPFMPGGPMDASPARTTGDRRAADAGGDIDSN